MAIRPIVHFPDAVLKTPCRAVAPDEPVDALISDLLDTMRSWSHCVGLAANQIGDGRRVAVVDITGHAHARSCAGELVLVNPVVISTSGAELAREGCMSVPELTGEVARATTAVIEATNATGIRFTVEADAIEARALLHELDHLDGHLFLDRVSSHAAVFRRRVYRPR